MKRNKGLTLIEISVVLSIMVIIAAITVQLFTMTSERARLRGDIQSARVIQGALELYVVERGTTTVLDGNNVDAIITHLAEARFLDRRNTSIQTVGAEWVRHNHPEFGRLIMVDINASPDDVHRAYASLTPEDQANVRNGDKDR